MIDQLTGKEMHFINEKGEEQLIKDTVLDFTVIVNNQYGSTLSGTRFGNVKELTIQQMNRLLEEIDYLKQIVQEKISIKD